MAKKKAVASTEAKPKSGGPKKKCPECGELNHSRKDFCWKCNHAFPKAQKKPVAKGKSDSIDVEKATLEFVQFHFEGSIANAIAAVSKFDVSPEGKFIELLGGKDKASDALDNLKVRAAQVAAGNTT